MRRCSYKHFDKLASHPKNLMIEVSLTEMSLGGPPHPGAAWRQLADRESGFPYYWNTATNQVSTEPSFKGVSLSSTIQVRWDVPLELVQYRQSIAPPPLPTNPPLPSDPPPSVNGPGQGASIVSSQPAIGPQLPSHQVSARTISQNVANVIGPKQPKPPHTSGAKTSLIAYDDSDSETDDKVVEQEPSKISGGKEPGKEEHTTEDILALLEAEKPPDYLAQESSTTTDSTGSIVTPSNRVNTTANGNQYSSGPSLPVSHQFPAPPPPVAVSQQPLPVRRPQLGSMLQVSSSFQ